MIQKYLQLAVCFCLLFLFCHPILAQGNTDSQTTRVFIFAGQSNMVGSDSKVVDIKRFPPFVGLEKHQPNVKFAFNIGRENKRKSEGWTDLQPVDNTVGPELSFARLVTQNIAAPIAIIKCAAGGTHLGGDWNPDEPSGFKMYPEALELIKSSLAALEEQNISYRIEGFMWHQGENDMFNDDYRANYGKNLKNIISRWRQDLETPNLHFYVGELCTKTIWGMDLRPRMDAIRNGQVSVTDVDPLATYVPTSHVGVEIGGGVGLHYHYGTLGQLEHGVNYGNAYLNTIGIETERPRPLADWPYKRGSRVKLFVLAGHRNMEGERAFVQELQELDGGESLIASRPNIAFKYSIGGGYKSSNGWEPLGPSGFYDTFGPELSFSKTLQDDSDDKIAIAKFTHSGTQIIDWTPEGSIAESRNVYDQFIGFVKEAVREIEAKGNQVEIAGIFYHLGENDMSFGPHRKNAAKWLLSIVKASRDDLARPGLKWYVSQQPPTDDESVNTIDVTANVEKMVSGQNNIVHIKAFNLPRQEKKLVIDTIGIVKLGELLAKHYLADQ